LAFIHLGYLVSLGCLAFGLALLWAAAPSGKTHATAISHANNGTWQRIEQVKAGQRVMAFDPATGKWAPREVIRTLTHNYEGDLLSIQVAGVTIEATGNHPFWVANGKDLDARPPPSDLPVADRAAALRVGTRWVEARSLQVGDMLLLADGRRTVIDVLSRREDRARVYNLNVADVHTYAVSQLGVLVHNKAMQINPIPIEPRAPLYEVGLAKDLRADPYHGVPTDTIAEHTPQSKWARELIPGADDSSKAGAEPAIRVTVKEATAITEAETLTPVPAGARDALALKIRMLRDFTGATIEDLRQVIKMNKDLHEYDYKPLHRE